MVTGLAIVAVATERALFEAARLQKCVCEGEEIKSVFEGKNRAGGHTDGHTEGVNEYEGIEQ